MDPAPLARAVFAALGGVMEGVRANGGFSDEVMAIADELGYFADHDVPAASLLLWSEGITGVPQPPERLEEPELVRRMCRIGADLQLTRLLPALVTAALAAGAEPGEGAGGGSRRGRGGPPCRERSRRTGPRRDRPRRCSPHVARRPPPRHPAPGVRRTRVGEGRLSDLRRRAGADPVRAGARGRPALCLTSVTPGVFSSARLASPMPRMADCRSCSVEC